MNVDLIRVLRLRHWALCCKNINACTLFRIIMNFCLNMQGSEFLGSWPSSRTSEKRDAATRFVPRPTGEFYFTRNQEKVTLRYARAGFQNKKEMAELQISTHRKCHLQRWTRDSLFKMDTKENWVPTLLHVPGWFRVSVMSIHRHVHPRDTSIIILIPQACLIAGWPVAVASPRGRRQGPPTAPRIPENPISWNACETV